MMTAQDAVGLIVAVGLLVFLILCAWAVGTDYYNRRR